MAVFSQLADPAAYRACEWDLLTDQVGRSHWIESFRSHIDTVQEAALKAGFSHAQCGQLRTSLSTSLDRLAGDPRAFGDRLDIGIMDAIRTDALRAAGMRDPFQSLKQRENDRSLQILPDRLRSLDALGAGERPEEIVRGIFAGNIFDMGATEAAKRFSEDRIVPFDTILDEVKPRPWLVDDLPAITLTGWRRAVLFVDNAGPDVVLGMLPLARELARNDVEVILAANSGPALNDITFDELIELCSRVRELDDLTDRLLRTGRLRVVATGTSAPILDLTAVSDELAEASASADLVVFEGMGRAVESNWSARLTCETWYLATIKDSHVAHRMGGEVFDCICRVQPPT
ncbi:MAG: DUF89 family protein [Phycisphaerales bacterium]|nr:DUF89 family protein [Phycisphaerales bacterium]